MEQHAVADCVLLRVTEWLCASPKAARWIRRGREKCPWTWPMEFFFITIYEWPGREKLLVAVGAKFFFQRNWKQSRRRRRFRGRRWDCRHWWEIMGPKAAVRGNKWTRGFCPLFPQLDLQSSGFQINRIAQTPLLLQGFFICWKPHKLKGSIAIFCFLYYLHACPYLQRRLGYSTKGSSWTCYWAST